MADITINPGINSVDYANGYALINTNQCYFIDVREIDGISQASFLQQSTSH